MATLYLHIGTPKTGTTAIQNFLSLNNKRLKEQGFCFPDFGYRYFRVGEKRNAHFLIYRRKCKPDEEAETRRLEDERFFEGLDKIKELTSTYPNVILSDEDIWNAYFKRKNFWLFLKNALLERGIELKVIVYLRRQDLLVESYYMQRVKTKIKTSFKDFLDSGEYSYFKLDYYETLKEISNSVGKENLIVRAYEKQQYEGKGNTLISDFMKVLGIELDEKFVSPDIVINTSLHGSYLEVKRILNEMEYFHKPTWSVKYLSMIQQQAEGNYSISKCECFTNEQQTAFLAKYKEGNAAVAREFMNRKDGVLFRDKVEIDKQNDVVKQYSSRELVLICGKMIELKTKDMEKKLNNLQAKLNEANRKLEYANRPLKKKITDKICKTLFKRKT